MHVQTPSSFTAQDLLFVVPYLLQSFCLTPPQPALVNNPLEHSAAEEKFFSFTAKGVAMRFSPLDADASVVVQVAPTPLVL
jgi:hypothetical protein